MPRASSLSGPAFQVLLALADGPLHGYAIIQEIRTRTGGLERLTASTLYAVLKRLLDLGWIEEIDTPHDADPRRRSYALTREGRAAGRAEAARLEALTHLARSKQWLPKRTGR